MKLLLKFTVPRVLVLVIMFSLIVVGCTENLSKSKKDGYCIPNEGQNLVSNGDIELLNNGNYQLHPVGVGF